MEHISKIMDGVGIKPLTNEEKILVLIREINSQEKRMGLLFELAKTQSGRIDNLFNQLLKLTEMIDNYIKEKKEQDAQSK